MCLKKETWKIEPLTKIHSRLFPERCLQLQTDTEMKKSSQRD